MAKARTGTLVWRKTGWFVRLTVDVEGEAIRKWVDLETTNEAVARRKKARLAKQSGTEEAPNVEAAARILETYEEAAARIRAQRRKEGVRDVRNEEDRDRLYLIPTIGKRDVREVRAADISAVLDRAADAGKSHKTLTHIRAAANTVFDSLWRDELIAENPVVRVRVPKRAKDRRERAVLTDAELAMYVAWQHPEKRYRKAVLERQVMSIMSRTFGGVRAGDLHALEWTALDTEGGAFAHGWAPRVKTTRPQKLEIPEVLRPFIRQWWRLAGEPLTGLVFPALRLGVKRRKAGENVGEGAKVGVSHAKALRRDLQRAFADAARRGVPDAPAPDSARWRELFEHTKQTKRVDFHSWRRAYNQALADADVNAQQAAALAGHADLGAHMRYLNNTSKMRSVPDAALPTLIESSPSRPIPPADVVVVQPLFSANDGTKNAASSRAYGVEGLWLRGPDLNRRPSGYECDIQSPDRSQTAENGQLPSPHGLPQEPPETARSAPRTILLDDSVAVIPAHPAVRLLDILAALDAAALVGDLHTVRSLAAEAARVERGRVAGTAPRSGQGTDSGR